MLDADSVQRAIEHGDYELAHIIILNLPKGELPDNELIKKMFRGKRFWYNDYNARYWYPLYWAKEHKKSVAEGLTKVMHARTDELAKVYDKRSPIVRFHNLNLVNLYLEFGDYPEAARRAEGNPSSFSSDQTDDPEYRQLKEKLQELFDLSFTQSILDKEALRKKVQEKKNE